MLRTADMRDGLAGLIPGRVSWDRHVTGAYSADSSSYTARPGAVVFPDDVEDVRRVVRFAAANGIGITPRGGGTGLVGGGIGEGIVMDLKSLDRAELSGDGVYVQAGVPKGRLDRMLEENGVFLGPNPSVGAYCTLGGMIATNASGSRSLKYGSMIDNMLGVEFVDGRGNLARLPDGTQLARDILDIARRTDRGAFPRTDKNSCGYRLDSISGMCDTHRILAASEGTLGIIVSARLAVHPVPAERILIILGYGSACDAAADCAGIARAGPAAVEFVDSAILGSMTCSVPDGTDCLLFVEIDGGAACADAVEAAASGALVARTSTEQEAAEWWRHRDLSLSYSTRSTPEDMRTPHVIEDAAVPVARLGELVRLVRGIDRDFGSRSIMYGHAGSGNLHVRPAMGRDERALGKMAERYFAAVNAMGGTITAEHGDGLARTAFVRDQYGGAVYGMFGQLKRLLDPHGILNPGKIVADQSMVPPA